MRAIGLSAGLLLFSASLALAEPPPPAAYGQLPAMRDATLSPSGQSFAYEAGANGKRYILVRSTQDGKLLQSIDANDKKIRQLRWADDTHLLIAMTGTYEFGGGDDKVEIGAVMLANLRQHSLTQLEPTEDRLFGEPLAVKTEGAHVFSYFRGPNDTIKRVDLDTHQVLTEFTLPPHVESVAMSPDAKILARVETTDFGRNWQVLAGRDGRRVLASGRSEHGHAEIEAYGRTADTLLFTRPEDGDIESPRELNLVTGEVGAKLVDGAEVEPIRDRKTRLLIGFDIAGRQRRVVFLDPAMQAQWESLVASFPGLQVIASSFSDERRQWIVHVEGDHDSGHFYLVDLAQKNALALGADYPGVKAGDVASARWFDYKAQDGTRLEGVLTLPPGRDPRGLPVVVMPHGGPAAHDTPRFDWWAQAIASRGYAVFQPNFRGSTGYGRAFEEAGWGQWGKRMQTDVSDGLQALVQSGVVDARRACIVGWSYGGYATLAGVALQNGLYRCAVAGGAVSDLGGMLDYERKRSESSEDEVNRYWRTSMALHGADDPAAAAASPAHHADRVDAPLLLIHGRDDTVVPFSQAQEMVDAMHRARKPVELKVLSGEDHWLSGGATRTQMLEAMIAFLERNNPPDAPGAVTATKGF